MWIVLITGQTCNECSVSSKLDEYGAKILEVVHPYSCMAQWWQLQNIVRIIFKGCQYFASSPEFSGSQSAGENSPPGLSLVRPGAVSSSSQLGEVRLTFNLPTRFAGIEVQVLFLECFDSWSLIFSSSFSFLVLISVWWWKPFSLWVYRVYQNKRYEVLVSCSDWVLGNCMQDVYV